MKLVTKLQEGLSFHTHANAEHLRALFGEEDDNECLHEKGFASYFFHCPNIP